MVANIKSVGKLRTSNAYDAADDMLKIKSMQKKFRDSFGGTEVSAAKWETVLGSGMTATVSGGLLTFASGVAANAEGYLLSEEVFTVPFRLSIGLTISQRIANQTFFVEAVSVNPATGMPDGLNCCALLFDGTTATGGKYRVQNSGVPALDSGSVTFPTTAGGGVYEVEPFADECWFHGGTMDSTNARSNSYRRHQQTPDPNAVYKLRLRWLNGATAPASSTNAAVQYIACQDYAELTAEITAGRGQASAGQAIGVTVTNSPSVGITGTPSVIPAPSSSGGSFATAGKLISAATTNATSVKASAAGIGMLSAYNASASIRYLKVYNKASAPTVGTDTPVHTIVLPAGANTVVPIPALGLRLSTGFSIAITGGLADSDTTAIGASEVIVNWEYV